MTGQPAAELSPIEALATCPVVTIVLRVRVLDEAALRKYAEERYYASWQADLTEDQGPSLDAAVFEALIGSNENPSPCDYGIEIVDWSTTTQ